MVHVDTQTVRAPLDLQYTVTRVNSRINMTSHLKTKQSVPSVAAWTPDLNQTCKRSTWSSTMLELFRVLQQLCFIVQWRNASAAVHARSKNKQLLSRIQNELIDTNNLKNQVHKRLTAVPRTFFRTSLIKSHKKWIRLYSRKRRLRSLTQSLMFRSFQAKADRVKVTHGELDKPVK